jgi:error-prone DNA polymerase
MPDIDLDFAADRREEVIQYVYRRYGEAHTAMVCNVVTYRARSALRDLAKALDFPLPVIDRLAKSLESHSCQEAAAQLRQASRRQAAGGRRRRTNDERRTKSTHRRPWTTDRRQRTADSGPQTAFDRITVPNSPSPIPNPRSPLPNHPLLLLAGLMEHLDGCPRHLSIHTGGMLITGPPLSEVVPLERATMPGRIVCQWDKESVEDAGLVKIDLLGLRTLGMISEALALIAQQGETPPDLDALPLDDPEIYRMLGRADTVGAFQVESRAQGQMLPRLKPERFEDIIVEVAIVRPGPIQGGAVHPYLRRRSGEEPITYAHPSLEPVLGETLGVLLFQEQAIRVAVVAAGFAPGKQTVCAAPCRAAARTRRWPRWSGSLWKGRRPGTWTRPPPAPSSPSWQASPASASARATPPASPSSPTRPSTSSAITPHPSTAPS